MRWVITQPGYEAWADLDIESQARELLLRHFQNIDQYGGREGGYVMVDFVESYIRSQHGLRKKSKMRDLTDMRSFFSANRADLLPDKRFKVRGDKPPVVSLLRPDIIRKAVMALDPMYASAVLCRWQGFLDMKRLEWVNMNCAGDIVKQLHAKQHPLYIWIPGRKHYENDPEGDYYTWWGKDAVDALTNYLDNVRPGGWPRAGEPIWVYTSDNGRGRPIGGHAFREKWNHQLHRMGLIELEFRRGKNPKDVDHSKRYGYGLHDLRDEAETLLHTKALKQGLDLDCVKFWMGQVGQLDRTKYDKFMRDIDYVREQYMIAEAWLNIISNPNLDLAAIENEKMKNMQQRIEVLEQIVKRFQKMTDTEVTLPI
jgi:hypothetical protein